MVHRALQDASPWLPQGQYDLTPGPENPVSGSGGRGEGDIPAPCPGPSCKPAMSQPQEDPPTSTAGADPAQTVHRSLIWEHF